MTQIIYTSRTPVQAYQRCKRLRWLSTEEGKEEGKVGGLEPKRKSLHLVVGSAVHAGMEVLLREGQAWLWEHEATTEELFAMSQTTREIEDRAVAVALKDLAEEFGEGVEVDPDEAGAGGAGSKQSAGPEIDFAGLVPGTVVKFAPIEQDSPIVIDFADFGAIVQGGQEDIQEPGVSATLAVSPHAEGEQLKGPSALEYSQPGTNEDYLREELAALVEGMVRAWARRRWKGLLEQFEVLEVEREGEWKLAEWSDSKESWNAATNDWNNDSEQHEIHFLSRHDGLLLERSTGYLYLQSFKTTGSWDRRKELDAQVDMQGLSEAVDVEKRFAEAHSLVAFMAGVEAAVKRNAEIDPIANLADNPEYLDAGQRVKELVSDRVAEWLRSLPDPPQILGVRYEYLLKGSRKKDRKDAMNPDRYVQESILCRAWKQEGITSEDRRWAWTYDWQDEAGKGRRLDYRSWQKAPVWKFMKVSEWIDQLDRGLVQEGALNGQGEPLDALGSQFVPVLTVYRSSDEVRDMLEQMEAQEIQIAQDVEEVRRAELEGGAGAKRSALNRLFAQNRQACSYPGICAYRATATQGGFCFGGPDPFSDPGVLERFVQRRPNHPQENNTLVQLAKCSWQGCSVAKEEAER